MPVMAWLTFSHAVQVSEGLIGAPSLACSSPPGGRNLRDKGGLPHWCSCRPTIAECQSWPLALLRAEHSSSTHPAVTREVERYFGERGVAQLFLEKLPMRVLLCLEGVTDCGLHLLARSLEFRIKQD